MAVPPLHRGVGVAAALIAFSRLADKRGLKRKLQNLVLLCGAAGLLWFAVQQLRPLLARLQQLAGQAGGDSFSILLQVLAIAFVAQLAADLCREAGLAAAAFCMEFVGRILAMLQALPLLQSLLASFLSFLS